jgi:hypothetical protein
MRLTAIVAFLICPVILAFAQEEPHQIFVSANQAYDHKDYAGAIEQYQKLLAQGIGYPEVYYNLGNAYFRQGKLGQAILNYRRALKPSPQDKEAKDNLDFARLYRTDKITQPKGFFLLSALAGLSTSLGLNLLSWLTAVAWWIFLFFLLMLIVYRKRGKPNRIFAVISLLFFFIFGTSLWGGIKDSGIEEGVILPAEVEAKSGPGQDYVSLFTVHQGLECQIEEKRPGWYLIHLPNRAKGWVPDESIGII